MTKLLENAIEAARKLTPAEQDEIALAILSLASSSDGLVPLSADERAAIERSRSAAANQNFASDAEVDAVWAKYGL